MKNDDDVDMCKKSQNGRVAGHNQLLKQSRQHNFATVVTSNNYSFTYYLDSRYSNIWYSCRV